MSDISEKFYILGSCVSRDIFKFSEKNELVSNYVFQSSLISQFSPPLKWTYDALLSAKCPPFIKRSLQIDFGRTAIDLNAMKNKTLLIDLVAYTCSSILRIGNTYITNNAFLCKQPLLKEYLPIDETIFVGTPKRLELWIKACEIFRDIIPEEVMKNCILHKEWPAFCYKRNGEVCAYDDSNIKGIYAATKRFETCYKIFEKNCTPGYTFELERTKIIADYHYYGSFNHFHYVSNYYLEGWDKTKEIITSKNIQKSNLIDEKKVSFNPNYSILTFQSQPEPSKTLIIASMHRSGSSLTASLLQSAGLNIGERLLKAYPSNIKGHFENLDFFEFHRAVLKSQGLHEDGWTFEEKIEVNSHFVEKAREIINQNCRSPYWGWKDPRTTLFLDFWAQLLPETQFLFIYRAPWEVVNSLHRRNTDTILNSEPNLAVKFWIHYNKKILSCYERNSPQSCLLANINTIIKYPKNYIEAINEKFKFMLEKPEKNIYDSSIWQKQRSDSYQPKLINYFFPEAIQIYERLEKIAWHPEGKPDFSWRELIKSSPIAQIQAGLGRSQNRLEKIKAELNNSGLL
ncbi:MAG TPA: DUF6270 domain-containing protein [Halomicronema sp.]